MAWVITHEKDSFETPNKYDKPFMIGPTIFDIEWRERIKKNY